MTFEAENDLERSLMRAATDPALRPQFYKDLASAEVFVIGKSSDGQLGSRTLAVATTVELQKIDHNGTQCIPIFSSLTQLRNRLSAEAHYLRMNAVELMRLTKGETLILNPGAEYGKEFLPSEIAAILDGTIGRPERHVLQRETKVYIGEPARFPTGLVDALTRMFRKNKNVKRAWIAHYFNPEDGLPAHTLLALDAAGYEQLVPQVGIVINGLQVPDPPVDIVPFDGKSGSFDYFATVKPFYERRFGGLF